MSNVSRSMAAATNRGFLRRTLPAALTIMAAALLLLSLKLPLWQMHLEAPQYREEEALKVIVYPGAFGGDLDELALLNQYIGVHLPETLPQFDWLPGAFAASAALGIAAALLTGRRIRSRALVIIPIALSTALFIASIQAIQQMRDIGHNRDAKAAMTGVKDFTPPFLGTKKIAQFTVTSRFNLGSWMIAGALAMQFSAAWFSKQRQFAVGSPDQKASTPEAPSRLTASAANR